MEAKQNSPIIPEKLKKKAKKFGSRLAFEFFLEVMHPQILEAFKKYLADFSPASIREMVIKKTFPPMDKFDFTQVQGWDEHLSKIGPVRMMKFLAEARPDLAQVIQDSSMDGANWVALLRQELLSRVKQPEKDMASSRDYAKEQKKEEETVLVTCDKCDKKFSVPKDKVQTIDKCPLCGA